MIDELESRRARARISQAKRRKGANRIDFYASHESVATINSLRTRGVEGTASAILNRIISEWAALQKSE